MPRLPPPIAPLLAALFLTPIEAGAQSVSETQPVPAVDTAATGETSTANETPAVLTLKERLGAKWKDEQRVNNCKVPPEKRGPKPRPEACAKDGPD